MIEVESKRNGIKAEFVYKLAVAKCRATIAAEVVHEDDRLLKALFRSAAHFAIEWQNDRAWTRRD